MIPYSPNLRVELEGYVIVENSGTNFMKGTTP